MNIDIVQCNRDLRRRKIQKRFDTFFWAAFTLLLIVVSTIYYREASSGSSDIYLHAVIASEFNFLDLHSITSRIAYPFWHVSFALLYKLGVPLVPAAAAVCVVYKMLVFLLVQRVISLYLAPNTNPKLATLAALAAMFVTAVRIPQVNPAVYIGIGSPTVWHNPTQIVAELSSLLCLFYTAHIVYCFRQQKRLRADGVMLPWKKLVLLAAITLFSAICKPTFLQAFLPACGLYFLGMWISNPKHTRFFLQVILAFLPAVLYFVMQYLYYTGVVVPFTSGVAISLTPQRVWMAVRNMLMMAAFPLLTLSLLPKKEIFRNPVILLCLLIAGISIIESALFYETGMRENHGNFNWASMNAAFLLWVVMLPQWINAARHYRDDRARLQENTVKGIVHSADLARRKTRLNLQSAGFLATLFLLLWHIYSGMYYLYYLFSTGSVF